MADLYIAGHHLDEPHEVLQLCGNVIYSKGDSVTKHFSVRVTCLDLYKWGWKVTQCHVLFPGKPRELFRI